MMRRAFRKRGHDARSVDLKPAEDSELDWHYTDNIFHVHPKTPWMWDIDLLIGHPICKRMANSGAKHLYLGMKKENGINPVMWAALERGVEHYQAIKALPAKRKAIENPVMHRHAMAMLQIAKRQFVQPWWFGDPFFKATGWDLENLPDLVPTNKLTPPAPGTDEHKAWSMVFRMAPGPEREADRSRTFPGHAEACAEQWGIF